MSTTNGQAANDMVGLIRDLIIEQLDMTDKIDVCKIYSVNSDGTYNIIIPPDEINVVSNIKSISSEQLRTGDYAYILKIKNRLSNSLILTRIGPAVGTDNSSQSADIDLSNLIYNVKINGTSVVTQGTANISTEGAYNATTNPIATIADLPVVPSYRFCYCNTLGSLAAKVVNLTDMQPGYTSYDLEVGSRIKVCFTHDNTTYLSPSSTNGITLNVANTGAATIVKKNGSTVTYFKIIRSGDILSLFYDGTYWVVDGVQKAPKRDTLWKSPSSQTGVPTGARYFGDTGAGLDIEDGRTTWLQLELLDYDVILFTARASSSTSGTVAHPTFTIPVSEFITRTETANDVYITWSNADTAHTAHVIYIPASSPTLSSSKAGFNILSTSGLYKDFIVYGIRYGG